MDQYFKMSNKMALLGISSSHVEGIERILFPRNIKNGQLPGEHNLCPWEFRQTSQNKYL